MTVSRGLPRNPDDRLRAEEGPQICFDLGTIQPRIAIRAEQDALGREHRPFPVHAESASFVHHRRCEVREFELIEQPARQRPIVVISALLLAPRIEAPDRGRQLAASADQESRTGVAQPNVIQRHRQHALDGCFAARDRLCYVRRASHDGDGFKAGDGLRQPHQIGASGLRRAPPAFRRRPSQPAAPVRRPFGGHPKTPLQRECEVRAFPYYVIRKIRRDLRAPAFSPGSTRLQPGAHASFPRARIGQKLFITQPAPEHVEGEEQQRHRDDARSANPGRPRGARWLRVC